MDKYINANIIFSKFCNAYADLKKGLPIRPSEMGVLNIIVQREGKFTPLMIAELLEVSKPMVTTHIIALQKNGYVLKEYSKEDKRSFYVLPTYKAKELVEKTAQKMHKNLIHLETALGEETFDKLLEILQLTNRSIKDIRGE